MALLEAKNLSFKYHTNNKNALNNVSFKVNSGDFVLLCGPSGCGKTTLLRLLKQEISPAGQISGEILFNDKPIEELSYKNSASEIGFVMQNPDLQIVTDKVWHELSFGLESLGINNNEMHKKVAEISSFFGITDWYHRNTNELSGGQKQLLNLASILVMDPKILLLDEPTAQLDPIAAVEFINSLKKINEELGITIIIVEHRVEELYQIATRVIMMDNGKIIADDNPREIANILKSDNESLKLLLPSATRLFHHYNLNGFAPLNVKEGKEFIKNTFTNEIRTFDRTDETFDNEIIKLDDAFFRYERETPDILKGLSLKIYDNEIISILGNNGSGKSTLLKVLSGTKRLYRGTYKLYGKKIKDYSNDELYRNNIAVLPQNPTSLFVKSTVKEELNEMVKFNAELNNLDREVLQDRLDNVINTLKINELLDSHPYDLSGGEMQKCALAKILLLDPKILMLDEPTKGLDPYSKNIILGILKDLQNAGKTIIIVTHDVEFASKVSNRCAMFFDGDIVAIDKPYKFFSSNNYYTTILSRMTRNFYDNIITLEDAIKVIDLNRGLTK